MMGIITTLASDYWFLVLVLCMTALWWAVRSLCDLNWQAVIVRDIEALLDRDGLVRVNLSERQIRYLGEWGFDVSPIAPSDNGLWYSEVTR
jgi:hypothetical protein